MVLAAFLDERGIHHQNVHVSRRASYLFMRVVKLLKAKLFPFIETILQSLQDTVARFTSMDCTVNDFSGTEDGSHIFEAIGLLIGMEDVPLEKQADYLSSLLTPLCHQVEILLMNAKVQSSEEFPAKIVIIQQIIMAINALSKELCTTGANSYSVEQAFGESSHGPSWLVGRRALPKTLKKGATSVDESSQLPSVSVDEFLAKVEDKFQMRMVETVNRKVKEKLALIVTKIANDNPNLTIDLDAIDLDASDNDVQVSSRDSGLVGVLQIK